MYGYPADMPQEEKTKIQSGLRAKLTAETLPTMLGYMDAMLAKSGTGWFAGDKPTIADCQVIPRLRHLKKGVLDGIPTTIFDGFENLKKFYDAFHAIPEVKAYYGDNIP